jgi:thiamine phosphate synthase YjbQ (UPF0047 family)
MSALTTLEAKLHAAWQDLTTDVRDELEQAVEDAKAEVAQLKPLLQTFDADLKAAVAEAEPGLKTDVEALVEKLLADAAKIGVADLGV